MVQEELCTVTAKQNINKVVGKEDADSSSPDITADDSAKEKQQNNSEFNIPKFSKEFNDGFSRKRIPSYGDASLLWEALSLYEANHSRYRMKKELGLEREDDNLVAANDEVQEEMKEMVAEEDKNAGRERGHRRMTTKEQINYALQVSLQEAERNYGFEANAAAAASNGHRRMTTAEQINLAMQRSLTGKDSDEDDESDFFDFPPEV